MPTVFSDDAGVSRGRDSKDICQWPQMKNVALRLVGRTPTGTSQGAEMS